MSLWQGKSKGNKTGYQFFVWVLKNLGIPSAYLLLKVVVAYFFLFSYRSSKEIFNLYHKRLGYKKMKALKNLYKNYYLLGQGLIDKVVMMAGIKNNFSYHFDGEENLRAITSLNKGGILLSAHIGNWDIAGQLLKRLDTKINIVMFDGEHQKIKEYLAAVTGKKTVNIIFIKNDLSHIYEISEALKNNELVCMHADRFLEGNKILTTTFLGQEARFPMGPFVLAATFKVPVSFVFAVKENNFHYHFFASEIKEYSHLQKTAGMQRMLTDYAENMELMVKKYPEQWFNYYNFWS